MQSNIIFAFIFVAFIFYITARGELATYIDILRGGGQQPSGAAGASSTMESGNILNEANTILGAAQNQTDINTAQDITNNPVANQFLIDALNGG